MVHLYIGCIAKKLEKQGKVVKATGIGNKRRFKVKWSDGM